MDSFSPFDAPQDRYHRISSKFRDLSVPSNSHSSLRSLLEQWKQLFLASFPQESEAAMPDDPTKDKKYNEPIVDSVRAQKDEVSPENIVQ